MRFSDNGHNLELEGVFRGAHACAYFNNAGAYVRANASTDPGAHASAYFTNAGAYVRANASTDAGRVLGR